MAVNKNFVVKNGIEVNEDLIFASSDLDKVGIGSTIPTTTLDVVGEGIFAQNARFSGITTSQRDLNVGTGATVLNVKETAYIGLNTAAPIYPVHVLNANPSTGSTINPTLYVEGDAKIFTNASDPNVSAGGGRLEVNSLIVGYTNGPSESIIEGRGTSPTHVGFVSTYNLYAAGISTFVGLSTFTNTIVTDNSIVIGFSSLSNMSADGIGATSVTISKDLNVTGLSTFKNDVHLLDGDILEFGGAEGATGDLRIFHGGTDSTIVNTTGLLDVKSDRLELRSNTGVETYVSAAVGAGVSIFFDNVKKVETTSGGAVVQGITTSTLGFQGGTKDGVAGVTTLAPSGGITTTGGDLYVNGLLAVNGNLNVDDVIHSQNIHVTGISTLSTLNVGFVTSGLVVGGGATIAGISSLNAIHVGSGGTVFKCSVVDGFQIGSATTAVVASLNGGSIPSIGLVIALGG
jgi:hypothetical protein